MVTDGVFTERDRRGKLMCSVSTVDLLNGRIACSEGLMSAGWCSVLSTCQCFLFVCVCVCVCHCA